MSKYRNEIARPIVLSRWRPLRGIDRAILFGLLRATGADQRRSAGHRPTWTARRPVSATRPTRGGIPADHVPATAPADADERPATLVGRRLGAGAGPR